jgi:hypothetical protein
MNVGYRPIAKKGVPALEWSRLSHVFQNHPTLPPGTTRMMRVTHEYDCGGSLAYLATYNAPSMPSGTMPE